jgi:phage-related protein
MVAGVGQADKPVVWLAGEVKTPPFSKGARIEAGMLLRQLQQGKTLGMPQARAMPAVGARCMELRIPDERQTWRILLRVDPDAVVIAEVFSKKTRATPKRVMEACRRRLRKYDEAAKEE